MVVEKKEEEEEEDVKGIRWGGVDCVRWTQERNKLRAVVNATINFLAA